MKSQIDAVKKEYEATLRAPYRWRDWAAPYDRTKEPKDLSIRVEPWINRAAAFAIANGYVSTTGKQLQLTEPGKEAAATLQKEGVLAEEAEFLRAVSKVATEQVVEHIMKMEDF